MLREGDGDPLNEHREAVQLVVQVSEAGRAVRAVGKAVAVATAAGVTTHASDTRTAQTCTSELVAASSALSVT